MKKLSLILFAIAFAFKTFSQEVPRFATSEEANAFIESKIESRLTPFLEKHDIDLSLFETYMIKVGFATPDSIGVGFVNFLNHLVVPINEEIRFDLLCGDFLGEVVEMIGRLSDLCFQDFRYIYSDYIFHYVFDYINNYYIKCIEILREQHYVRYGYRYSSRIYDYYFYISTDCNCVFVQQFTTTNILFARFYILLGDVIRAGDVWGFITTTRDDTYTKEIFEKSIYQPFYLFCLSLFPHFQRVISGEAIFLCDFLDNREEIREARMITINTTSAMAGYHLFIEFIHTASGKLEDVRFFNGKIREWVNYEDLDNELRAVFSNLYFPIGLFNGESVSYFGTMSIRFREPN